jgi:hypothetical protein
MDRSGETSGFQTMSIRVISTLSSDAVRRDLLLICGRVIISDRKRLRSRWLESWRKGMAVSRINFFPGMSEHHFRTTSSGASSSER